MKGTLSSTSYAATNLAYAVQAGQYSRPVSQSLNALLTVSAIPVQSPRPIFLDDALR
jgi:hypothetical protein